MATHPYTAKHYNEGADQYHDHISNPTDSPFHTYYEKPAIRAELPDLNGLDVISIGCGSGVDARWLADNGANKVVGIDISSNLLEIAKRENPDIEFAEMDMEQLGFDDESFDLAYSSLAIHYIDDWTPALKEALRILKPGGQYVFSCGHPIDSAMEFGNDGTKKHALLGREVDMATSERTHLYGDYLAAEGGGIKPIHGMLKDIDVVIYHRPFSKMIEQILASGFEITKLVEPLPQPGMGKHFEQLQKAPTFMVWVLGKPN